MKTILPVSLIAGIAMMLVSGSVSATEGCDGYRTQTPGGWGAPAKGNNPGVYRNANFDAAFPEGLTIGCGENTLTLTSASAVQTFLPCGGPSNVLNGPYTDPNCIQNVFAGHLVALTLSVMFDEYDEDFSEAEGNLADAVINQGMFQGWTVLEIWQLANEVIGGCNTDYTPNQVKGAIASINENFVDGDQNNGFLDCEEECPDTDAPVVVSGPEDTTIECNDALPNDMPVFEDEDDDLEIDFSETTQELECGYQITRTWTATDDCLNSTSWTQVITVTDTGMPYFSSFPDDATFECDEVIEIEEPIAADDCSSVTVSYTESTIPTDCASEYTIIRLYTATDGCGNTAQHELIITVVDTTAPELSMYPENIMLPCKGAAPKAPFVTAYDNCDAEVAVEFEEVVGELGEEGTCSLITPVMDDPVWAMVLFSMPGGTQYYTVLSGSFIEYPDNTAQIEVDLVSTVNPNAGFHASVHLINGMNWDEWSNQGFPTSYKDDLNVVTDEYLDWTYYIIDNNTSSLTGWGDFEGSYLDVNHAPSSLYYGYQVGLKASNVNENYGHGGWMSVSGQFVDAANDIDMTINASGDFAFEQSCCQAATITRTWTAVDCAGNEVSHTQVITFSDLPMVKEPVDERSGTLMLLENYPNPTSGQFTTMVQSTENTVVELQLLTMLGTPVKMIYRGELIANQLLRVDMNLSSYAAGVYILRVNNGTEQENIRIIKE